MRRINLLPPELAAKRRSRQIASMIVIAGMVLLGLMFVIYGAQRARLASARGELERQQRVNAGLQRQVTQLSQFAQQQEQVRTKEQLLDALIKNEVRWSQVLTEISLVIPADDWLTNFSGLVQQGIVGPGQPIGTIQVSGCTLLPADGTHLNVAQFLVQLGRPLIFADDPFLTLSSIGSDTCPVQFSAQLQLTEQSRRGAQPGGGRRI
ncbi:MAG TPA: hypothetical protein VM841_00075 [Actinomycetota bacterium]|nr:hypothetical protein [Actinomycetota bacterium]